MTSGSKTGAGHSMFFEFDENLYFNLSNDNINAFFNLYPINWSHLLLHFHVLITFIGGDSLEIIECKYIIIE